MRVGVAAIVIASLAAASLAHADGADPVTAHATAAELGVLQHIDREEYIKARTDAEAILDHDPKSFIANWAMARIQHDEEGNHARALYYVHIAEESLHTQFGDDPSWDKKLLLEEFWINHEMDRMADALEVLDRYESRYGKGQAWLRIWPTFKLGRMDEARAIGKKLTTSDDPNERREAYNGLLSIEFEAHDRKAAYKWAELGLDATQGKSCTLVRNAAGTAYTMFRLREAEELGLKAHEAEEQDCDGAGYDQLAGLYLIEGEFQKAIAALKSLKEVPIPKRYRPHYALERRAILADILYTLGKVDDAERLASEVYGLPERTGMTSGSKRAADIVRSIRYWMALDAKLNRQAEKAAYGPLFTGVSLENVQLAFVRWALRREIIQLVDDDTLLVTLIRPNLGELYEDASWRRMQMIDILGTGVVRDAVAAARKADEGTPEATPYLDLFDAEISYREGNLAGALHQASAALDHLPKEEATLRWRTLAWEADARRQLGDADAAAQLDHEVLQKFPSVLRILDLSLPISTKSDGSELADDAVRRVGKSPRFTTESNAPFVVSASTRAGVVELCLTDASGFSFACASGDKHMTGDDEVISALDAFHDAAFSPKISLDQSDLNSLDGSPVRASSDQVLKGILGP